MTIWVSVVSFSGLGSYLKEMISNQGCSFFPIKQIKLRMEKLKSIFKESHVLMNHGICAG